MDVSPSTLIYRCIASGIALLVLKLAVDKALSLQRAFATIKNHPGRQGIWLGPFGPLSLLLGRTFPRPGMAGYAGAKFSSYREFGVTSFASVIIPSSSLYFWLADAEAIRIASTDRQVFQRDDYEMLSFWGGNVISVDGSDWKRHRSIAMSAFNEANVALVWAETMRLVQEWFDQLDVAGPDIPVDVLDSLTQVTLLVIISASFGRQLPLTPNPTEEPPPNCKLTFQTAVTNSMKNLLIRALIPEWFYRFSSFIKIPYLSSRALMTQLAFNDLRTHMLDLVASARAEVMSGKSPSASGSALLWNLVEANMSQDGDSKTLTDDELLSNIFVFLLAGHETSAHSSSFALLLLALHPDCQEKVYEEVTRIWPADVPLSQLMTNHKEYMDKLEYTVACIREALRVTSITPRLPKAVRKDTVLPVTHFVAGSKDSPSVETGRSVMAIPAKSVVVVDAWAIHMNPLYWGEDAAEYRPERFIDTESYQWPRHAFIPFSAGARSCIGQRFAMTEMVGILANVVRRYRILVPDDLANKSFEEQKEALLAWTTGITSKPLNARVKLSRRI